LGREGKEEMLLRSRAVGKSLLANMLMAVLLLLPVLSLMSLTMPVYATTITRVEPTRGPVGTEIRVVGEIDTLNGYWTIFFDYDNDTIGEYNEVAKSGRCESNSKTVDTTFTLKNATCGSHGIILMDNFTKRNGTALFDVTTSYYISVDKSYIQEGETVKIITKVTGGEEGATYVANVTVVDPKGNEFRGTIDLKSITDAPGFHYNDILTYPSDFSSAHTDCVGTYNVYFNGTLASTSFRVGILDKEEYSRFETVNIKTSGWADDQYVNVTITDPTGKIVFTENSTSREWNWFIPYDAPLGKYTVEITNATGTLPDYKPDEQTFDVVGTGVLNVTQVSVFPDLAMRTGTVTLKFKVKYPDNTLYNGTTWEKLPVHVYYNDTHVTTIELSPESNYEPDTGNWNVTWIIPKCAKTGSGYKFQIDANSIEDKYGNKGPEKTWNSAEFSVDIAGLTIRSVEEPLGSYNRTLVATWTFNVTYPNGSLLTPEDLGSIEVKVGNGTHYIANLTYPDNISYSNGNWTVRWKIPKDASTTATYNFAIIEGGIKDKCGNCNPGLVNSEKFSVSPATLIVEAIYATPDPAFLESYVTIYFEAFYPEPFEVTTGSATITLIDPDGMTHNIAAIYDPNTGRFKAKYWLSNQAPTGNWTAELGVNSLDDNYGNRGPNATKTTTFIVKPEVALKDIWTWLTETLKPEVEAIENKLGTFAGTDTVASLLYDIKETVEGISLDLTPVLNAISDAKSAILSAISNLDEKLGTFAGTDTVASLLYEIKNTIGSLLGQILDGLDALEGKLDNLSSAVSGLLTTAHFDEVVSGIQGSLAKLGTFAGTDTVASLLYEIKDATLSIEDSLVGMEVNVGQILAKLGTFAGTDTVASLLYEIRGMLANITPARASSGSGTITFTASGSTTIYTGTKVGTVTVSISTSGIGYGESVRIRYYIDPTKPTLYIQKTVTANANTAGWTDTAAAWKVEINYTGTGTVNWAYSVIYPP